MAGPSQPNDQDDPWASAPGIGSSFIRPDTEECPYDQNHVIASEKMLGHMMECRKAYAQKCEEEGQIPITLTCKYNIEHVVYAPEIQYHEERCTDADFVPTYLLNTEPFQDCPEYDPAFETLEPTQAELDKLFEGCYVNTFIGADSGGIPVPFSELRKLSAAYKNSDECDESEEADEATTSSEKEAAAGDDIDSPGMTTTSILKELSLTTEQKEVEEKDVDTKAETEEDDDNDDEEDFDSDDEVVFVGKGLSSLQLKMGKQKKKAVVKKD